MPRAGATATLPAGCPSTTAAAAAMPERERDRLAALEGPNCRLERADRLARLDAQVPVVLAVMERCRQHDWRVQRSVGRAGRPAACDRDRFGL